MNRGWLRCFFNLRISRSEVEAEEVSVFGIFGFPWRHPRLVSIVHVGISGGSEDFQDFILDSCRIVNLVCEVVNLGLLPESPVFSGEICSRYRSLVARVAEQPCRRVEAKQPEKTNRQPKKTNRQWAVLGHCLSPGPFFVGLGLFFLGPVLLFVGLDLSSGLGLLF
ncbi:hypothetical protein Droror1_Dr00021596 [Drosera rotundifolia]